MHVVMVQDFGCVKEYRLPAGWILTSEITYGFSVTKKYCLQQDNTVKLIFYLVACSLQDDTADEFRRRVLSRSPRLLNQEDVEAIRPVLRGQGNPEFFQMERVWTGNISGKRVLLTEGYYPHTDEKAHCLYMDLRDDGRVIQEIFFAAPAAKYEQHVDSIIDSFAAIVWKGTEDLCNNNL